MQTPSWAEQSGAGLQGTFTWSSPKSQVRDASCLPKGDPVFLTAVPMFLGCSHCAVATGLANLGTRYFSLLRRPERGPEYHKMPVACTVLVLLQN